MTYSSKIQLSDAERRTCAKWRRDWEEANPELISHPHRAYFYASYVLKRGWLEEAKPLIVPTLDSDDCVEPSGIHYSDAYISEVLNFKMPEPVIKDSIDSDEYVEHFNIKE